MSTSSIDAQRLDSERRDRETLEALQEVDDRNAKFYTAEEVEKALRLRQGRSDRER